MLHGRDAECALVAELLDAARRSESRVLVVRGEPGAGKTALLADAPGVELPVVKTARLGTDPSSLALDSAAWEQVGIRVNPDVEVDTHVNIQTGHDEAKFGVPVAVATELLGRAARGELPWCRPVGVHVHVGSQLPDPDGVAAGARVGLEVLEAGRAAGLELDWLDVGGGLPVDYAGEDLRAADVDPDGALGAHERRLRYPAGWLAERSPTASTVVAASRARSRSSDRRRRRARVTRDTWRSTQTLLR